MIVTLHTITGSRSAECQLYENAELQPHHSLAFSVSKGMLRRSAIRDGGLDGEGDVESAHLSGEAVDDARPKLIGSGFQRHFLMYLQAGLPGAQVRVLLLDANLGSLYLRSAATSTKLERVTLQSHIVGHDRIAHGFSRV
jgi:hypothetical protein